MTAQGFRPTSIVMNTIKQLGILNLKTEKRAGQNYVTPSWDNNQGVTEMYLKLCLKKFLVFSMQIAYHLGAKI